MDINTIRRIANDCMSIAEDDDTVHLDMELAIALGWKLRSISDSNRRHWEEPRPYPGGIVSYIQHDTLPRFTKSRNDVFYLLNYIDDSYGYHVIRKGPCSFSALVEWNGPGSSVDAITEIGAILASILFTLANKQEALAASDQTNDSVSR